MALYELSTDNIVALDLIDFVLQGLLERADRERLLRDHIEVVDPDPLVISQEFSRWEKERPLHDLLAVNRRARLVLIELERTADDCWQTYRRFAMRRWCRK